MLAMIVQSAVATSMWEHAAMTEEEIVTRLKQAADAKKKAERDAATAFETVVVDALRAGLKPKAVATATGYSYETIRRIARAKGVEPLREPTVTSRKRAEGAES